MKLEKDLIFLNEKDMTREALFGKVSSKLLEKGSVTDGYLNAVIARENDHPTAMQLEKMVVAIPHVDVDFVHKEGLVVITSPEGIEFKNAEDDSENINANVIFCLLVKNKDNHLPFLIKLMGLFRETEKMEHILKSENPDNVISIIQENVVNA